MLAHPDMSLVLRDTDLSKLPQVATALAGAGQAAAATTGLGQSLDGTSVLSAHAGISRLGWIVFVQLPLGEALAPVYAALGQTAALLGLGILFATAVGTLLARRMVEPIRRLQAGAERLGAGDFDPRIDIRAGDEIETLGARFNYMAGKIRESYATLEAKVAARTHDLNESLERQTATSEILRVISQSPTDTTPVFEAIALAAVKLLRCDLAGVGVVTGAAMLIKAVATPRGLVPDLGPAHDVANPEASFPARALASKKTLYLPDWSQIELPEAEQRVRAASGMASCVYVPMLRGGQGVGVLIFGSKQANNFDSVKVAQAESFADQALIAIENCGCSTRRGRRWSSKRPLRMC